MSVGLTVGKLVGLVVGLIDGDTDGDTDGLFAQHSANTISGFISRVYISSSAMYMATSCFPSS